jgi:hypothetical protein
VTALLTEVPLDLRAVGKRWAWPAGLLLALGVVALVLAAVGSARPPRPLDPRDASPVGGRALAELLRARGTTVDVRTSAGQLDPHGDETVVVSDARAMTNAQLASLSATAADVVLVAPSEASAGALGAEARPVGDLFDETVAPQCALPAAETAGTVTATGPVYSVGAGATGCYPTDGGVVLVVAHRSSGQTFVFGSADTLFNENLTKAGNAALGINLLGAHSRVEWLAPPAPVAALTGRKSVLQVLPRGVVWAALQIGIAVVLLALWRARRLGPVVAEPLPVVVRATETVEGRARLLRAARARGPAAGALRTATRRRLAAALHLDPSAPAAAVVDAVAMRTGRSAPTVGAVLYGADPADDMQLVALAAQLDELEDEVRRT